MKRFLCTSAFMISLAMLCILGPSQSLTDTNASASSNEPIKILAVNLNANSPANWLEGLELQIENTSGKTINYLLLHVAIPDASGQRVSVPITFGQPAAKNGANEVLQSGAKVSLKPAKAACDRMRQVTSGRRPNPKDFQTSINVVVFADKSAWKAGEIHYQDRANASLWRTARELSRSNSSEIKFAPARYKPNASSQQCYRYTGFTLEFCCDSNFVANANFTPDVNGNVQPVEAEACCGSGNCCIYTDIGFCP
jgi:hypothetical protein